MELSPIAQKIQPSPTLSLSARARKMKAEGKDVIALSAGELDFPPPDEVLEAAREAINSGDIRYTAASGMPALKKAICERYARKYGLKISPENVVVSSGAKHALANTLLALLKPSDKVVIPSPYWVSYPEMVKLAGGLPVVVETEPENEFKITTGQFEQVAESGVRVIMLNSPSNPTGAIYSYQEIIELYQIARQNDIIILADEIYEDLILSGEYFSFAQLGDDIFENVVIISGVSKTYAMTGWRIGWAVGHPELIAAIGRIQAHQTSNPCTISQYASIAALEKCDYFPARVVQQIRRRRDIALEALREIPGFEPIPPRGAFYIFCDVKGAIQRANMNSSTELAEYLLEKALVATVPGEAFGVPSFLRLSIAASETQIVQAIKRIKQALT